MQDLHSIDISKCPAITDRKEITGILENAIIKSSKVKICPSYEAGSRRAGTNVRDICDFLKVAKIKSPPMVALEMKDSRVNFDIKKGDRIEVLIDIEALAYFFVVVVSACLRDYNRFIVYVEFPEKIYKINRRNYFRYSPGPEYPIPVEFNHGGIPYDFYINDISGSGLSVTMRQDEAKKFSVNDPIEGLQVFFIEQTLAGIGAKILRVTETTINNEKNSIVGMEFVNLSANKKDSIIRNIFLEHRKFVHMMQNEGNGG